MLKKLAFMFTVLITSAAFGQSTVLQGGATTQGHVPVYGTQGTAQTVILDSGKASGSSAATGAINELGLTATGTGTAPYASQGTGPYGANFCDYDAPINNATGYHYLCLSPNAGGGGLIAYGNSGTASALPLTFKINGSSYQFPFTASGVVGPSSSTSSDVACWNNTTGTLLKDCGTLPTQNYTVAACTNSAGDGAIIQTAVNVGKAVWIQGPCYLDSTVTLSTSSQMIFGSGANQTNLNVPQAAVGLFGSGVFVVNTGNPGPGPIFQDFSINFAQPDPTCTNITGYISGTTLTVNSVANGSIAVGSRLLVAGYALAGNVTALGTGTGGAGTYTINQSGSFGSSGSPTTMAVLGSCTRTALKNYPPAIFAQNQTRVTLRGMKITAAMIGIDMRGNSGGWEIDDLKMSALEVGIWGDGGGDTNRVNNWHSWPFGNPNAGGTYGGTLSNAQLALYYQNNTSCTPQSTSGTNGAISFMSGSGYWHMTNHLTIAGQGWCTFNTTAASGWPQTGFGPIVQGANIAFDTFNGLTETGGVVNLENAYFTLGDPSYFGISQAGGLLNVGNSYFYAVNQVAGTSPMVAFNGGLETGIGNVNVANMDIHNSVFDMYGAAEQAVVTTNSNGNGSVQIVDNIFETAYSGTYPTPIISSTGNGTILKITNNTFSNSSTGTGTAISVAQDNFNIVTGNAAGGWNMSFPTSPALGIYTCNTSNSSTACGGSSSSSSIASGTSQQVPYYAVSGTTLSPNAGVNMDFLGNVTENSLTLSRAGSNTNATIKLPSNGAISSVGRNNNLLYGDASGNVFVGDVPGNGGSYIEAQNNLIPATNNTYSLGTSGYGWANMYGYGLQLNGFSGCLQANSSTGVVTGTGSSCATGTINSSTSGTVPVYSGTNAISGATGVSIASGLLTASNLAVTAGTGVVYSDTLSSETGSYNMIRAAGSGATAVGNGSGVVSIANNLIPGTSTFTNGTSGNPWLNTYTAGLTLTGLTGVSANCLYVNSSGQVNGSGSACGASGGGTITAVSSANSLLNATTVSNAVTLTANETPVYTGLVTAPNFTVSSGTGVLYSNYMTDYTGVYSLVKTTGSGAVVLGNNSSNITASNNFIPGVNTYTLGVSGTPWANTYTAGLNLTGITGSTQCLHVNTSGVVSGTGLDCGSGSGGISSVTATSTSATSTPLTSSTTSGAVTLSYSTQPTFTGNVGAANVQLGSSTGVLYSNYLTDYTGLYSLIKTTGSGFVTLGNGSSNITSGNNFIPGSTSYTLGSSGTSWGNVYTNTLNVTGITGSTQCLQASSTGLISGTGSACGSGGGGSGTVASSTVGQIPVYTGATTVTGNSTLTYSSGTGTVNATNFQSGSSTGVVYSNYLTNQAGTLNMLSQQSNMILGNSSYTIQANNNVIPGTTSYTMGTSGNPWNTGYFSSIYDLGITGSTQCLQVNASGLLQGTGSACAGGGSGTITGVTAGTGLSGGGTSGTVTLNNTGLLSISTATTSTGGTPIALSTTSGAATLTYNTQPTYTGVGVTSNLNDGSGHTLVSVSGGIPFFGNTTYSSQYVANSGGSFYPYVSNSYSLGISSNLWTTVYATTGTINTSDARLKDHITDESLGLAFIKKLRPVSYTWIADNLKGVYHGLIAQEVEQALDGKEFAGLVKPEGEDGKYGLRYTEFVAPMVKSIQQLADQINELWIAIGLLVVWNLGLTLKLSRRK